MASNSAVLVLLRALHGRVFHIVDHRIPQGHRLLPVFLGHLARPVGQHGVEFSHVVNPPVALPALHELVDPCLRQTGIQLFGR